MCVCMCVCVCVYVCVCMCVCVCVCVRAFIYVFPCACVGGGGRCAVVSLAPSLTTEISAHARAVVRPTVAAMCMCAYAPLSTTMRTVVLPFVRVSLHASACAYVHWSMSRQLYACLRECIHVCAVGQHDLLIRRCVPVPRTAEARVLTAGYVTTLLQCPIATGRSWGSTPYQCPL